MTDNWSKKKLEDAISLQRGHDIPSYKRIKGNVPVIGSAGITGYHNKSKTNGPGVTIGRSGASMGTVTYSSVAFWPHNTVLYVTDFKGNNERFIGYMLELIDFKKIDSGSAQSSLNRNYVYLLDVTIPDINTQNKIASFIVNYDNLIENNAKKIEILDQMVSLIYDEWFVKFRFPGHEKTEMVISDKKKIPKGWEIKKIKDCLDKVILGGTPARKNSEFWNGNIPWIKSGKLNDLRVKDGTENITELGLIKSATKLMPKRTVLIAITGAILISISEIELCANQSVVGLYGSDRLSQEYIYLYEKANINQFISKMSGSAQQHINKEIIQNSKILLPQIEIIEKFNKIVVPMFDSIAKLLFINDNLKYTRDLLLLNLMNRKIDASNLDIKIPVMKT